MSIAQEKITWRDYQPTINQTFHCKLILTFVFSGQVYIVKYMKKKKKNRNAPRARECPLHNSEEEDLCKIPANLVTKLKPCHSR